MTDYASQEKTRQCNVVDPNNSKDHKAMYTAISRISAGRTLILQGFDHKKIPGGCTGALRQEFRELEKLDDITKLAYSSNLPNSVSGDFRKNLIIEYRKTYGKGHNPSNVPDIIRWTENTPFEVEIDIPVNSHVAADSRTSSKQKIDSLDLQCVDGTHSKKFQPTASSETQLHTSNPVGPIWHNNSCAYNVWIAVLQDTCKNAEFTVALLDEFPDLIIKAYVALNVHSPNNPTLLRDKLELFCVRTA